MSLKSTFFSRDLYGNADWMGPLEAMRKGLFRKDGLIVGKKWLSPISIPGDEHLIVFAPSGSGKTTSIVIPNLLTWDESALIVDVKLELFAKTSGFREQCGHKVFLWNPGAKDGKTHRFNPLDLVSRNPLHTVDDLQKISQILIPDSSKTDQIWTAGPRNLFVGIALYILQNTEQNLSIGEVLRTFTYNSNFDFFVRELLNKDELHGTCAALLNSYLETPDITRGGIRASFEASFSLFNNPLVDTATSASDFDIRNLRKEKISIYIGVTNDNLVRFAPLLNLFFEQTISTMTSKEPDKDEPHRVCFFLDEFPALGKLENLKANIGLLRSYRIKVLLVIQDISQLKETYGHHGAEIFLNLKTKVAFSQSSFETSVYISKLLGDTTTTSRTSSYRGGSGLLSGDHSVSNAKRPLLLPQEIISLPKEACLIMMEGSRPAKIKKIPWYDNPELKDRIRPPVKPPIVSILQHEYCGKSKDETIKTNIGIDML